MKKKRLNIQKLSVESFITEIEHKVVNTVKGGAGLTAWQCQSYTICEI